MAAQPAKYFAFGPYKAEAIGPNGWWGVKNRNGFNCLTFTNRPGHVFALEAEAKSLAEEWNNGKVFEYPPDPFEGKVWPPLDPVHNARFGKYVRSQRFVNGRWVSPIAVDENWAQAVDEYDELLQRN